MFRRLKFIYSKLLSDGIISTISWTIARVYHQLIPHKQVIWSTDLTKIDSEKILLPDNITIQRFYSEDQINKEDLKILMERETELMGSAGKILMKERFNKGAVLWLLKENEKLAGYRWTIVNNHMTPTYFPHTETDVHSIGLEIFPEFRGRNLFSIFLNGAYIISKNEGSTRCYSETYLWRKQAVKANLKFGSNKIGIATRFKLFRKNIVIWHDTSNKINFK